MFTPLKKVLKRNKEKTREQKDGRWYAQCFISTYHIFFNNVLDANISRENERKSEIINNKEIKRTIFFPFLLPICLIILLFYSYYNTIFVL